MREAQYNGDLAITANETTLEIMFIDYVNKNVWLKKYGVLQKMIREWSGNIVINFHQCKYIDPFPLLALLLEIENSKQRIEEISIEFNDETNLKDYICKSGFNKIINKVCDKSIDSEEEIKKDFYWIMDPIIDDCNNIKDINSYANSLITSFASLKEKMANNEYQNFKRKIYHILIELIDNVLEHAYDNSEKKLFALYIRYVSYNDIANKQYIQQQKYEMGQPLTFTEENIEHIDLFFLDIGCGINDKYPKDNFITILKKIFISGDRGQSTNSTSKTNFGGLYLINQILNTDSDYIYTVMLERKNIPTLAVYGNNATLNIVNINDNIEKSYKDNNIPESAFKGFPFLFKISWKENKIRSCIDSPSFYSGKITEHPVYKSYLNFDNSKVYHYKNIYFLDEREWDFRLFRGNSRKIFYSDIYENDIMLVHSVWMPESGLSKNGIIKSIRKFNDRLTNFQILKSETAKAFLEKSNVSLEEIKKAIVSNDFVWPDYLHDWIDTNKDIFDKIIEECNKKNSRKLVICDVNSYEMLIYHHALHMLHIKVLGNHYLHFDQIVVISNHYEVYCFSAKKEENKLILHRDIELEKDAINSRSQNIRYSVNLITMANYIKFHDSVLFWQYLYYCKDKNLFFNADEINWEEMGKLSSYLNLENVIKKPKLYFYIKRSIARCIGYEKDKNIEFFSFDMLTDRITQEINLKFITRKNNTEKTNIIINGVITDLYKPNSIEGNINIALFENPTNYISSSKDQYLNIPENREGEIPKLLFWISSSYKMKENFQTVKGKYKRLLNTHVLLPYAEEELGTKIILRGDKSFIKVYEKSSYEIYNEVQYSYPKVIKIGHFEYDGFHDYINYDFWAMLEDGDDTNKGAFGFILNNIFHALLSNQEIKVTDKRISKNQKDKFDLKAALVLYSSHIYTDHLVQLLSKYLPDDNLAALFVPITTIRQREGAQYRITPNVINIINNAIEKAIELNHFSINEKNNIIFLDTLMVSGRTRKDIKHLILSEKINHSENIGEIISLVIIDSRRLPYYAPSKERLRAYWRMDIPRLSSGAACYLCESIEIAASIVNEYNIKEYKEIIDSINGWCSTWCKTSAFDNDNSKGLKNYPIEIVNTDIFDRGFAFELSDLYSAVIYCLESHNVFLRSTLLKEMIESNIFDDQTLVAMICSTIIMYGSFKDTSYHEYIIRSLIISLSRITQDSSVTMLATLLLLMMEPGFLKRIMWEYNEIENLVFRDALCNFNIWISYFAVKNLSITQKNKLPGYVISIMSKSSTCKSMARLHGLLVNDAGKVHELEITNTIRRYIDDPNMLIKKEDYSFLHNAFEIFNNIFIRIQECLENVNIMEYLYAIDSSISQWSNFEYKSIVSKLNDKNEAIIASEIFDILNKAIVIHNQLFIRLGRKKYYKVLDDAKKVEDVLLNLFSEDEKNVFRSDKRGIYEYRYIYKKEDQNKQIEETTYMIHVDANCKFDLRHENVAEVWYFFNDLIARELKYTIRNVSHCCKEKMYYEKYNMMVNVSAQKDFLSIFMKNYSDISAIDIITKVANKDRVEKKAVSNLDVTTIYTDKKIDEELYEIVTEFRIHSTNYYYKKDKILNC